MGQRQQAVCALQNPRQTSEHLRLESARLITSTTRRQLCESSEKKRAMLPYNRIAAIADTVAAIQEPQQTSLLSIYPLSFLGNLLEDSKKHRNLFAGLPSLQRVSGSKCKYREWAGMQQTTSDHPYFTRIDHQIWSAVGKPTLHPSFRMKTR